MHAHPAIFVGTGAWYAVKAPAAQRHSRMGDGQAAKQARTMLPASQGEPETDKEQRHQGDEEARLLIEGPDDVQREIEGERPGKAILSLANESAPPNEHDEG